MLRAHATIFETRPDGDLLREHVTPVIGFQLFRHKTTGAYLLDGDNPEIDISGFAIIGLKKIPATKTLKAKLNAQEKAGFLESDGYRLDLISDAIRLSHIFQTRVMIAYFDDESSDMVAIGNLGTLERAFFNGALIDEDEEIYYEIEVQDDHNIRQHKVQREFWNDIFIREFKLAFGQVAPDLTDLGRTEFERIDREAAKESSTTSPIKKVVFLVAIVIALVLFFQTRETPQSTSVDSRSPELALEELCAGEVSNEIKDMCRQFEDIKNKDKAPN